MFIETYFDENIHSVVAKIVSANNFKALTTEQAGNKGKSDPEQLEFAASNHLAIATHNRTDFESWLKNISPPVKRIMELLLSIRIRRRKLRSVY